MDPVEFQCLALVAIWQVSVRLTSDMFLEFAMTLLRKVREQLKCWRNKDTRQLYWKKKVIGERSGPVAHTLINPSTQELTQLL